MRNQSENNNKMDILYAPWRLSYILSEKEKGCIFCLKPNEENDEKNLILYRSVHSFIIMNMFPYNNGHVMIVPLKHVSNLSDLEVNEFQDLFDLVKFSEVVLKKHYRCDGLNIGMNLGKAAGAGIDEHLHVHIVPRWQGDSNFMTTVNGTRVIPESFERAYSQLKESFMNCEFLLKSSR